MHHSLCVSARQPQIHLTHEQQQILSHDIQPDHVVKIVAFAGKLAVVTAHGTMQNSSQCPCEFCIIFIYPGSLKFLNVATKKCVSAAITSHVIAVEYVGEQGSESWLKCLCTVFHRHGEDDHTGEVRRAAARSPFPVCGLQQVSGQGGSVPLPQ